MAPSEDDVSTLGEYRQQRLGLRLAVIHRTRGMLNSDTTDE
ncbi:MAG: hypothetical protein ACI8XM_001792 [Haloarculaceae archaeon]|jgi:hypothetical protein